MRANAMKKAGQNKEESGEESPKDSPSEGNTNASYQCTTKREK